MSEPTEEAMRAARDALDETALFAIADNDDVSGIAAALDAFAQRAVEAEREACVEALRLARSRIAHDNMGTDHVLHVLFGIIDAALAAAKEDTHER